MDPLIRTDFKTVDKRDPVSSVMGYLSGDSDKVPVVLDGEKPYGVLNEAGFARKRLAPTQKLEGAYVIGTRTLGEDPTIDDIVDVLGTSRTSYAPVVSHGRVVGVVHARDVLQRLDSDRRAVELADETPVVTKDTSAAEVIHFFNETGVPYLPVLDESGKLGAVVRRRDLVLLATDARPSGRKAAGGEMEDPRAWPIEGFLEHGYETVNPDASFDEVRDALKRSDVVVVVDPGTNRPRGVLTAEGVVGRLRAAR